LDDLIVGAYQAQHKIYLNDCHLPDRHPQSNHPSLGGFVINGEAKYDYSGRSVSSAGDVNGDGLPLTSPALETEKPLKLLAISPLITKPPKGLFASAITLRSMALLSALLFGKADSSAIDLSAIADASNPLGGFVINGEATGDRSGYSVSSAGDVNGDGLDDLILWGCLQQQ
jgi:hypothetical protein